MHDRYLFSFRRRRERGDLCRLETLAAAARLGTAWLQEPAAPAGAPPRARADHAGTTCRGTPEHCHG